MPQGFCFVVFFLPFFQRGHTLHVFHLYFVSVLFSFAIFVVSLRVCLSTCFLFVLCENQHAKAARRWKHNLQNSLNIVSADGKKIPTFGATFCHYVRNRNMSFIPFWATLGIFVL
jgi:hypothetical protein